MESRRPLTTRSGDEINLAEYAATCWRYKWVILGVALLVAAVTYAINRQMTPIYQATVRLLATESKVNDGQPGRTVSVARFRELLESPSLVASVLEQLNLTKPPHGLTPQAFLARDLTVTEIPDTGILRADLRLSDPGTLVKLANAYADRAILRAEELNLGETEYARGAIGRQAELARARLTDAENALETFRKTTQIELLRKDVDALLQHRPDIMALQMDIETEGAQLRQAEIELSQQQRVRDVRRSLDGLPDAPAPPARTTPAPSNGPQGTSPIWTQPLAPGDTPAKQPATGTRQPPRPTTGPSGSLPERGITAQRGTARQKGVLPTLPVPSVLPDVSEPRRDAAPPVSSSHEPLPLRSELNDPYVNPVYEVLARDVAQSRTRLAGLKRRYQQLVNELKLSAPTNAKLDRLYGAETQLAHLIDEYEVARAAYMNAASKFEEARLEVTVRNPRLQILDRAQPPERPVAPRIPRNVAAATLLALTMTVVAVIVFDSSRQRRG